MKQTHGGYIGLVRASPKTQEAPAAGKRPRGQSVNSRANRGELVPFMCLLFLVRVLGCMLTEIF